MCSGRRTRSNLVLVDVRKLNPTDSLWLAVLEREESLRGLPDSEVRRELEAGGFPDRVITAFLLNRTASQKKAGNLASR